MFFRRPFYVPTRVQSKQAEIAMQRLPTDGEMHPNDMAVCPVGKAARATVNKTVWGGAGKSAIRSASIPKSQPFGKKKAAIFAAAIGAEIGMYDGGYHTK